MTKRILVISGDILPYPGFPTTGAGLRAWGIGKGLQSKGHDVLLAMPKVSVARHKTLPKELLPLLYEKKELSAFIAQHQPDVVVLQHWRLANFLDDSVELPLVIDFHGPLLLEAQFQNNPMLDGLRREKIAALHKADFFTCAGEKQRYYFFPWLMMAGCNLQDEIIKSIPVSLSPELPEHQAQGETSFVYGGVFLPWQDPVSGLLGLVEHLERQGKGVLKFFGGKHPLVMVPTGKFEELREQLQKSSRVQMQPMIPRDQLIQEYCRSHVAMDIMQRNAERELAFTTRTVEYLWCGLPVIYNDYAELASYIKEYDAGWTLDPQDPQALQQVLKDISASPELVAERSQNAQRLVRERLTWDKTVEPLNAFCQAPFKREKGPALIDLNRKSLIQPISDFSKKIHFHIENEGIHGVLKRGWRKLLDR